MQRNMDLEDEGWVNIPYDGLLEVHDDGDEKVFSRKYFRSPKKLFKMDYFNTPQESKSFIEKEPRLPKQLVPIPILGHGEEVKEITELPILVKEAAKGSSSQPEQDQDPIFQVFFKKENEFVEMKMGSSKSNSRETNLPYIETGPFQYEEKSDDTMVVSSSPSKVIKLEEQVVAWGESNERVNFWKWGLSGIGAFCSLGVAAATICILILGNGKRGKQHNQKLRIEIYSDNKRIKQVVHHANEAMSAVRGVPLPKAHITYGGYYEAL